MSTLGGRNVVMLALTLMAMRSRNAQFLPGGFRHPRTVGPAQTAQDRGITLVSSAFMQRWAAATG